MERGNFLDLPPDIISSILATFCDGKSISTFLIASMSSLTTTIVAADGKQIVQCALLVRYNQLTQGVTNADLRDILIPKLMQQIRDHPGGSTSSLESIKFLSEHCAMVDYFETHLSLSKEHWLIWCGEFETFYGNVQAYITSPYWSMYAIDSWYRDLELTQFSIVRPLVHIDRPQNAPFGSILGIRRHDIHLLDRLRLKLEPNVHEEIDYWKCMVTAIQFAYDPDPPLIITPHSYALVAGHRELHIPKWISREKSLCCYWDDLVDFDDDSMMHLGERIIRLMRKFCSMHISSLSPSSLSFEDSMKMAKLEYTASIHDEDDSEESDDDESQV
jgi:hypothetical protein